VVGWLGVAGFGWLVWGCGLFVVCLLFLMVVRTVSLPVRSVDLSGPHPTPLLVILC
jgi:hypothetical protein